MTRVADRPVPRTDLARIVPPARARLLVLAVAVGAGALLGVLDLIAQRSLPYPWANLANSASVWAIGAFALGMWTRSGVGRAALAGVVGLLVAVEAYYLAAVVIQGDSTSTLTSPSTQIWLVLAVLAGSVFGAAGHLTRSARRGVRLGATSLTGLVFLLEALRTAGRSGRGSADDQHTALIEVALAVIVPLVVLTVRALATRAGSRLGR